VETLPRLTAEEETALAAASGRSDQTAYKKLIEANLRLVMPVAHRYEERGVSLDDLVNAGTAASCER
jgi:DNA-directed RNA polymerase sigma subunit (sigma70/sigma32)